MYQFIPLHSCDYQGKISIKSVETNKGNAGMKSKHSPEDKILQTSLSFRTNVNGF